MAAHEIHAGHADHHEEHDDLHVTVGDYVKGFIQDRSTLVMVLGLFAAVQVVVHMVYFLHMNSKIQGGWTLMTTIFSIVFVMITIAGTLWVMFHMNANMMPHHHAYPHGAEAAAVAPAQAPAAVEHAGHGN